MSATPDYPILGPPRISAAGFTEILRAAGSPATPEAAAAYSAALGYGVDPAVLLAIFRKESTFGRFGRATSTRSWGNIRNADGSFRAYGTWTAGATDAARLLAVYGRNAIRPGRQTNTVQTLPYVWAPSADGNAPDAYGDQLASWITDWQRRYPATGSGPGVASSSNVVTAAMTSTTIPDVPYGSLFRGSWKTRPGYIVDEALNKAWAQWVVESYPQVRDYFPGLAELFGAGRLTIEQFNATVKARAIAAAARYIGQVIEAVPAAIAIDLPAQSTTLGDTASAIAGLPAALAEIGKRGLQAVLIFAIVLLGLYLLSRG